MSVHVFKTYTKSELLGQLLEVGIVVKGHQVLHNGVVNELVLALHAREAGNVSAELKSWLHLKKIPLREVLQQTVV